jgi:hypothetical protein
MLFYAMASTIIFTMLVKNLQARPEPTRVEQSRP